MLLSRADRHNNPTAMITALAAQGGLVEGKDYLRGEPFQAGAITLYTAKMLGDSKTILDNTIQVINRAGFYNQAGAQRWAYIAIPLFVWVGLTYDLKLQVIGFMYGREGGTELKSWFQPANPA